LIDSVQYVSVDTKLY